MMSHMLIHECGHEVIAVVVAVLHPHGHRKACGLSSSLEHLRLQLPLQHMAGDRNSRCVKDKVK